MDPAKIILARLEAITGPAVGYTNDTRVWPPDSSDNSDVASFKRQLLSRCLGVLDRGKACLSGASATFTSTMYQDECKRVESVLEGDVEQREYYELVHYAQLAAMLLNERYCAAT